MTTGKFHRIFGKVMMTLLHLDIDVIITFVIIILRKIKEQVMPRLMWSLSASSLVVRRQLATLPHDHLQPYIFFPIVHTTIFNPISFATHPLLVLCMRKRLFSSHVKCHSTCDPSSTLHLLFNCNTHSPLFHFQNYCVFLDPTMFNSFHLSPHLNR